MRLERIQHRPLDEDELIYKNAYMSGDGQLWRAPMTYAQYVQYLADGAAVDSPTSYRYKEHSVNRLGNTINDVRSSYNVGIALHKRYSYPILHDHEYIEIVYVVTGYCLNYLDKVSIELHEGDVCILAPNAYHALSCLDDDSCIMNIMVSKRFFNQNFLHILSSGKVISEFLERVLYQRTSSPYILFPCGQDSWLQELAQRMLTENTQRRRAYDYSICILASEFLLHLSREHEIKAIVPGIQSETPNNLIVAILGYLAVNYNHATLKETAQFFGYSASYLSRTIRDNTGKNYNDIILDLQMEHAAELLLAQDKNYTEIAQDIGCYDSSHFNKKFKAYYGISPKQYVESHAAHASAPAVNK